jgi:phospholipase C
MTGFPAEVKMSEARGSLEKIEHIVVLMLENRSFDHMLGYLSLPADGGGAGRIDVDGLKGPEVNFNEFGEPPSRYPIAPFDDEVSLSKAQDPCHSGPCVAEQMEGGMGGFVRNYMTTRPPGSNDPAPGDPMRYQTADDVPVYDFLAGHFAVCDRWFCSVPGSTWPNRIASLAGEARETSNKTVPLYERTSFVRSLPVDSWRWYSSDPGSLRLVDRDYLVGWEDNFAQVEKPSALQPRTLYGDIAAGELPEVAWIDPNFVDLGGLSGADDDHPPTDVMAAQSFVLKIYNALRAKRSLWRKTMLVIVYDEHGGFYDHRSPADPSLPDEFTERAEFGVFGPRVPAIVVSPFVKPGSAYGSAQGDRPEFLFDHTSLIKTILLRFAGGDFSAMPERVATAAHLGHLLTEAEPNDPPAVPPETIERVTDWWGGQIGKRLENPQTTVPAMLELEGSEGEGIEGAAEWFWRAVDWLVEHVPFLHPKPAEVAAKVSVPQDANELELGIAQAATRIRGEGLPPGQP